MNLHAFNATPIAGWKTQSGFGASGKTMAGAGQVVSSYGARAACTMSMAANAQPQVFPRTLGIGALHLDGAAFGNLVVQGTGHCNMALTAADVRSAIGVLANALSDKVLDGAYGIPATGSIPAGFVSNRADRTRIVAQQGRRLIVPAEPIKVRVDHRRLLVEPDRRSA